MAVTRADPAVAQDLCRERLEEVYWRLNEKALKHRRNGDQLRFLIYREAASQIFEQRPVLE